MIGTGEVSQEGVDYYHNVLDELLLNGIEPAVTLYHWDLPEALQQQGGWTNPDVALWFEEYAAVCFLEFGNKVISVGTSCIKIKCVDYILSNLLLPGNNKFLKNRYL